MQSRHWAGAAGAWGWRRVAPRQLPCQGVCSCTGSRVWEAAAEDLHRKSDLQRGHL